MIVDLELRSVRKKSWFIYTGI